MSYVSNWIGWSIDEEPRIQYPAGIFLTPPPELAGQWGQYGHVIEHGIVRYTTPDEIRTTSTRRNNTSKQVWENGAWTIPHNLAISA
eukprot:1668457-Prymnesium_polylepis.1